MDTLTAQFENRTAIRSSGEQSIPPIFITGVWRCGATLLYLLLNQHPDIALLYESDLPVLWPMFRTPGRRAWVDKWEYWNSSISRHDLDPARLAFPARSLAQAFEAAGSEYAEKQGKKRWGCKSPSYFDRLDQLAAEFPKARFIVVWRDPEEICRSARKAAASGPSGAWFARPGIGVKTVLASYAMKKQVEKAIAKGAHVYQIHYRDLVSDTENVMRRICEFLQVSFDPGVKVLNRADRSAVFKGAHHTLARGSSIDASEARHNALPTELASKIARYRAYWKASNGDSWLLSERFAESSASPAGLWERGWDRAVYLLLRCWDLAPRMAFSILPLSVWQMYRRAKYRDVQYVHRHITNKPSTLKNPGASSGA